MIVKVCFGFADNKHTHQRIIECDDMHLEEVTSERDGSIFTQVLLYRAHNVVAEVHVGTQFEDHIYVMDNGKTVDHTTYYPRVPKEVK